MIRRDFLAAVCGWLGLRHGHQSHRLGHQPQTLAGPPRQAYECEVGDGYFHFRFRNVGTEPIECLDYRGNAIVIGPGVTYTYTSPNATGRD